MWRALTAALVGATAAQTAPASPGAQATAPCVSSGAPTVTPAQRVSFSSGPLELKAQVYRPCGEGPFPVVVYAHGAEEDPAALFDAVGPALAARGVIVFAPHRRGAGLSADQGSELFTALEAIGARSGQEARARAAIAALEGPHLDDIAAAIVAARETPAADAGRVYLIGNGFGGVLALLAAERGLGLRAVADFAGAAGNWDGSALLRERMIRAARRATVPIYLAQAANDRSVQPTLRLGEALAAANKPHVAKVWPAYGVTADDGHGFGVFGASLWADEVLAFFNAAAGR